MDVFGDIAFLAGGLVLLFFGGEGLVRGSTAIAERSGFSRLIVGLVIVGFGTSAPELLVSVQAALGGAPDIAVGNVVGSNIANILLIVGISAAMVPLINDDPAIRRDLLVMLAASALIVLIFQGGTIGRFTGAAMFAALLVYLAMSYHAEKRRLARSRNTESVVAVPEMKPLIAVAAVLAGIAMLVLGARLMVDGATSLALHLGISEAVIGLTIVAIGTSLPELATAIIAARKREVDVILGNVVGSNIFNILCILGVTAMIEPIAVAERFALIDGPLMLALSFASLAFLFAYQRIGRLAGAAMLVLYAVYIGAQNAV
ncbi:K+-dependent Na+/Ca+ exchanger related-protein [Fulvimarina pelagi HTCC2506]|uniref:K+-dependent Na+/Ca+ exchanger related-protein n=1 Tax=Fulvimarina pelagi HTCC2506 TaxID=314231 RepID=Q0G3V0_9HYPH|nr:calcium/sodium antiporter [Fulvimarina pelagi]EAU41731.1 K+-dependent Na+/Ca+ exchanger related-protein [Fulvimarina pelagi HTCC2506]